MITHIEIDGFKTFKNFEIDLAPFQVIVGVNGVGKSNLFDALQLLSSLAEKDLRTSFQEQRGEANELFTQLSDGTSVDKMRFCVEMLVEDCVKDSLGTEANLSQTRLRYTLEIRFDKQSQRLQVSYEQLVGMTKVEENWFKGEVNKDKFLYRNPRKRAFISTSPDNIIKLRDNGRVNNRRGDERTMLSSVTNASLPHVFAAREEMRKWRLIHLASEALRQPSSSLASSTFLVSNGSNLANVLYRLKKEASYALHGVSRDLNNLVSGVADVEVNYNEERELYSIQVKMHDGRIFSSQSLADSILRMAALLTLRHDPKQTGVLCLEEPEIGVHPESLYFLAYFLKTMATEFSVPIEEGEQLQQVLINAQSPLFVSQPHLIEHLLVAHRVIMFVLGQWLRVTHMHPVVTDRKLKISRLDGSAIDQVLSYLSTKDMVKVQNRLKKVRATYSE